MLSPLWPMIFSTKLMVFYPSSPDVKLIPSLADLSKLKPSDFEPFSINNQQLKVMGDDQIKAGNIELIYNMVSRSPSSFLFSRKKIILGFHSYAAVFVNGLICKYH